MRRHSTTGWEDVSSSDWEMLHEIGRQHVKSGTSSWFLMWIPLRKKTHKRDDLGREVGAIVDRFLAIQAPQNSNSEERNLERSLAFVLPLLKHLKTIEHVGDENSQVSMCALNVRIVFGLITKHRS